VPVLTYSFDQSFLDFYGSSVWRVESAIQILNNLPPASQINLNAFPFDARQENYRAAAGALIDLKSETLFLLLQQLGLANHNGSCIAYTVSRTLAEAPMPS